MGPKVENVVFGVVFSILLYTSFFDSEKAEGALKSLTPVRSARVLL